MKTKENLKWVGTPNFDDTSFSTHCYYPITKETEWTGEKYEGVAALCNKNRIVSEDGETSLSIDKLVDEGFGGCKTCEKIYQKIVLEEAI